MSHDVALRDGEKARKILEEKFERWVIDIYEPEELKPQTMKTRLETLSDTQLKILDLLSDRFLTAEEIGVHAGGISRSTVLYHLKGLVKEGFIRKVRRGKKINFATTPECIPFLPDLNEK